MVTEAEVKDSNPKDALGVRKAGTHFVPAIVKYLLGLAFLEGARKYGGHNYRVIGVRSSVYHDAIERHLDAWWEGEDHDPESGAKLPHLAKIMACCAVLLDAELQGKVHDDRPPKSPDGWMKKLHVMAGEIIDNVRPDGPEEPFTEARRRDEEIVEAPIDVEFEKVVGNDADEFFQFMPDEEKAVAAINPSVPSAAAAEHRALRLHQHFKEAFAWLEDYHAFHDRRNAGPPIPTHPPSHKMQG